MAQDEQRIKTVQPDSRSANRLVFRSTKQRSKAASADVYRHYKRRIGVTSAATREERVHFPSTIEEQAPSKRRKHDAQSRDKVAVLHEGPNVYDSYSSCEEIDMDIESTFASELELAHDRNASEIFSLFYRDIWHLVRSLPEVLHHASDIVDICMSYLLSDETKPEEPSKLTTTSDTQVTYIPNQATTDILHLLSVLARDLRHEIHAVLHSKILPRILYDLLNPPPPPSGRQAIPMSVTLVETAFRTLGYIFKYDAEAILSEVDKPGQERCLENMRQYYGATLGNSRDYVRRLAAETFAPLVRKCKSESARRKHVRRVIRALAATGHDALSNSLKKAQADAIDGVAHFLLETARGMAGRLHSKGHLVVGCVLDCLASGKSGMQVLYQVTSVFVEKICHHVKREYFCVVWKELFRAANSALSAVMQSSDVEAASSPLPYILELLHQVASFKNGILLRKPIDGMVVEGYAASVKSLVGLLRQMLESTTFSLLSPGSQMLAIQLLAASWRAIPDDTNFASQLSPLLPAIMACDAVDEHLNPATILSRDLLPFLPPQCGVKLVGRSILSAAARQATNDAANALMILFSVASIRPSTEMVEDTANDDNDNFFFTDNASFCNISSSEKETLIDLCLMDANTSCVDSESIAQLGVVARCLPFLLLAGNDCDDSNKETISLLKRIRKWLLVVWKVLDKAEKRVSTRESSTPSVSLEDIIVAKSLLLESYTRMATSCIDEDIPSESIKKSLVPMQPHAEKFLLAHPYSLSTVKGVAAFVDGLQKCNTYLNDSPNEVFEALVPNLRQKNHFLRLHSLEILASFPKRPFVTDHAEIDWTDDLDEEPMDTRHSSASQSAGKTSTPTGLCDIIETLLKLESLPIRFENERQIVACITRIEILGRSSRIPVLYAEAAANHMLGILYVKFSPIWPAAIRALVALTPSNEASVWEPLVCLLREVTAIVDYSEGNETKIAGGLIMTPLQHHQRCMAWETTHGSDPGLFRDDVLAAKEVGRVSRHLSTDESTVFGLVWSVLEESPELTAKKSRVVVPIFLEFLHSQYFAYHENHPDARELRLENEMEDERLLPVANSNLGRGVLDKRLVAFLKVFGTVNGPQQLYKHRLLLPIFTCFVANQDPAIAKAALSCILKFKQPFVTPYADNLKSMLKKGELRDTMLNFDISKDAKVIDPEHREALIALITRILFGRLSARAAISKSSKETPATRRASILSFLSVLDGQDGEHYPLFYMMVRTYIPKQYELRPMEGQDTADRENVFLWLQSVKAEDLSHLREQRHEGFLNLLSTAISQLGHDIEQYVPAFMSIVLAVSKYAEVQQIGSTRLEGAIEENEQLRQHSRKSVLRTLSFRRLAELYQTFASTVDFIPYGEGMWDALSTSVGDLPVTVAYADKAPALLLLLRTLSTHSQLIFLLAMDDEVVPSAIKCIADTSKQSVANVSLDFVENLLKSGCERTDESLSNTQSSVGLGLIRKHLSLLLHQLAIRLGSKRLRPDSNVQESTGDTPHARSVNTHCTLRRELSILCRLSTLIVDNEGQGEDQEVLQMLCELLVPFLSPDRRSDDQDQMNVMEIISALIPRIEGKAALPYYAALSRLFGPFKSHRGITSLAVRKSLASVIETIAKAGPEDSLSNVAGSCVRLCAIHYKRIDEIDYDEVLGVLNELGSDASSEGWLGLCRTQDVDPTVLSPLIGLCFHFLYDEDGVVSRAAFKALNTLISCTARQVHFENSTSKSNEEWIKLAETAIVPVCRNGLASKNKSVRRLFVLLFSELARSFKECKSPNLYGDLNSLVRDDDPDLDFFLNVTHVQIHRRSRAFQRLRKMLLSPEVACPFSMHSLSNFLLPLAMHPIFESETKADEPLALEAVETIGAIAAHLSWSKYHSTLWTMLNQFERNLEQERYLVGAICSVLDAFHFKLVDDARTGFEGTTDDTLQSSSNTAVWRALEKRIIPKTESLLIKEKVDRTGTKVKNLRPAVVLALSKLFRKFPESFFEPKLARLLVVICGALKSRDSDAREIARKTLAKMTIEMGVAYLSDIVRQLALSLTEGYQLHVRMATLHTILHTLEKEYQPQLVSTNDTALLPFDSCIPGMMDLIQQDLFGTARERKEAEGAMKRLVKEASGSKSLDAVELICRMMTFVPSSARHSNSSGILASSIHTVVTPFLERLRTNDITAGVVGRIGECLTRVVVGVSHNQTATSEEVLPFVFASIAPFVDQYHSSPLGEHAMSEDDSDNDDEVAAIQISRTDAAGNKISFSTKRQCSKKAIGTKVVVWRPSTVNTASSAIDARQMKYHERRDLRLVQDGASAPKLTGSGRLSSMEKPATQGLNDPASISGVTFGLSLLYASLKKGSFDISDEKCRSMLDPFIPVLTTCFCNCQNDDVILLSLRSLGVLLRLKLPSTQAYSPALGAKTLDILTLSGNLSNLNQELTQVCFKTLTLLIQLDASQERKDTSMPLDEDQMQVLISLLKAAVVESDHHHPTLGLIKAIVSRQFMSTELYDLMDTMLDLSVKSHKSTLRELSSKIFMQYLVSYPMGEARLADHLKHVVLNVKYEYEEGRLSAIALITSIIEKLPVELLETHSQLFFLPLVLQFVNDDSKACREALSDCLSRLLSRASMEVVQSFYDYTERWSLGTGPLKRTSLQLFGLFIDARSDFFKKGGVASSLIDRLYEFVENHSNNDDWEIQYFALLCFEKLCNSSFSSLVETNVDLWVAIIECLTNPHPWIKRVASRMIGTLLNSLEAETFASNKSLFLVDRPGMLYQVTRNLCSHLDLEEDEQNEELAASAIKSLVWVVQAMHYFPELCYADKADDGDDETRNPVTWLMARLSNIAKPKGSKRRENIFKCFAAFVTVGGASLVLPYLELVLEPLHRSITESDKMMESIKNSSSRRKQLVEESQEATLAKDVLHLLEESCESEIFLKAYGAVKTRAQEKREARKKQIATEAVVDPQASAVRKMKKHEQEKRRRKRKIDKHRAIRGGGTAKKRHL